jgi:hypothetical protein
MKAPSLGFLKRRADTIAEGLADITSKIGDKYEYMSDAERSSAATLLVLLSKAEGVTRKLCLLCGVSYAYSLTDEELEKALGPELSKVRDEIIAAITGVNQN